MKWPAADELVKQVPLPAPYRSQGIVRAHIAPLIASIRKWHPDIAVGANSCFLQEDFYHDRVCLDVEDERDICVVTIWRDDELVGMWSGEREADSLAIYGRLIIMAPEHRGARVTVNIMAGMANVGRAMGAAFLYCMVTLKNPYLQQTLEDEGYRLLGFMPGYDRQVVAPGVVKRVYQAVYAKLLVTEDEVHRPDPKNLTPRARALFELLFSN
jgi:hypothetical protein